MSPRLTLFASLTIPVHAALFSAVLFAATLPVQPASAPAKSPPKPAATTSERKTIAQDPYLGAIAVEAATGRVLWQDQPDAKGYPASVLKLMDLLIVLEHVQRGQISLQDQVTVSARAAKTGGSQVWLAEKEVFTVDDLLYALMVQSANDAAVALAEKVAGSAEAFVELMNAKARQLGMANTSFHSVHGLPPGKGQLPDVSTARDLSVLCRELLKHADTLRYTSTRERTFRPDVPNRAVVMRSHNHVMAQVEGCDGLKTGYFAMAGFSVAVTAARDRQRVVVVVLGSVDRKVRDSKAGEIVAKSFAALRTPTVAPTNAPRR